MRTVIFDLDGTLADTSHDLIDAANACFLGLGRGAPLDPVADAGTAFRGGRAMLTLGFDRLDGAASTQDVDREYPKLLRAYGDNIARHTRYYPGALEAVQELISKGYKVGICTNKPTDLAEKLVSEIGGRTLFGSLIGATSLPVRKPDPAPYVAAVEQAGGLVGQSVLIGDTVTDRDTARAAGVPVILVTFGPDGESVRALAPDSLLPAYDALIDRVQSLIG